jgi:hypothetical protein
MGDAGVLVGAGDRAEHHVRNLLVAGGGHDGVALGDLGVHSSLERSSQREHTADTPHRRTKGRPVIEGANDNLNAELRQACNRSFCQRAHHCADLHPARE